MAKDNFDCKRFPEWMKLKEKLHRTGRLPAFSERQIWWAALGENVGIEINGKSKLFSRPVLVYKKLSRFGFLGIPLTSQKHDGPWYTSFVFQNEVSYAAIAQARVINASRLYGKRPLGQLSIADFRAICKGFDDMYHFDFSG